MLPDWTRYFQLELGSGAVLSASIDTGYLEAHVAGPSMLCPHSWPDGDSL